MYLPNRVIDGNVEATLIELMRPNVDSSEADRASTSIGRLVFTDHKSHNIVSHPNIPFSDLNKKVMQWKTAEDATNLL